MKILINTPVINKIGGLANYYNTIKDKFIEDVDFFTIGSRFKHKNIWQTTIRFIKDNQKFYIKLRNNNYDIIHLNPSLDFKSIFRESIFILISKLFHIKVLVMFHGWDKKFENLLMKYFLFLFKIIYFKSDAMVVLSSEFKDILKKWGYKKNIYLNSTAVDDNLLIDINEDSIKAKFENDRKTLTVLFLARVEKAKGIYETICAYKILKNRYGFLKLIIAGEGTETENVHNYIKQNKIDDIEFVGYVKGNFKKQTFVDSDIYILPTHGEGMPISVLEAMAFGLPIITRPVGGLKDFFEDGKMGYMSESKDPKVFAEFIEELINDKEKMKSISIYNYRYAKEHFLASKIVKRLEEIYKEICYN